MKDMCALKDSGFIMYITYIVVLTSVPLWLFYRITGGNTLKGDLVHHSLGVKWLAYFSPGICCLLHA